jgi:hypothetical protein
MPMIRRNRDVSRPNVNQTSSQFATGRTPNLKNKLAHAARVMAPTLVALTFASVAHAQGTMDFSGAQTLMGTFNWRNDYVGIEQWSRFIRDGQYVFHTALYNQHEQFAKQWDSNLRLQGFAEAFEQQQPTGTYLSPADAPFDREDPTLNH